MDDQQLLEHLRNGADHKALARLYRHLPSIRRMIRHYGGSRQQAEDIFQEALIILCRKARQDVGFALPSGIYPYLYSVCRFLWNDELRKQQRLPVADLDEQTTDHADAAIAATVEAEQRFRLAEQIVANLGDRCRELLMLFYERKKSLRDIAADMGYSSEQTAKNQKYKCLETARNQFRQADPNNF